MDVLYPVDDAQVHRHSSIDQFRGFLAVMKKGGWSPIVFDQLDSISCDRIKTHPIIISFGDDLGYVYPEAHCTYTSDKFIYFDEKGVKQKLLPECYGGKGEFLEYFSNKNTFLNYDSDNSVGVHNTKRTRVGLSYVKATETLPAID